MLKGQTYTDTMDRTRTVVPVDETGKCRVYFDGDYVGMAHVPARLFTLDDWEADRIGFKVRGRVTDPGGAGPDQAGG